MKDKLSDRIRKLESEVLKLRFELDRKIYLTSIASMLTTSTASHAALAVELEDAMGITHNASPSAGWFRYLLAKYIGYILPIATSSDLPSLAFLSKKAPGASLF